MGMFDTFGKATDVSGRTECARHKPDAAKCVGATFMSDHSIGSDFFGPLYDDIVKLVGDPGNDPPSEFEEEIPA